MTDLRDRLNALLIAKFAREPGFAVEPGTLAADPTLESLGFDSLALVTLATAMEGEFGVELDEEANEKIKGEGEISSLRSKVKVLVIPANAGYGAVAEPMPAMRV